MLWTREERADFLFWLLLSAVLKDKDIIAEFILQSVLGVAIIRYATNLTTFLRGGTVTRVCLKKRFYTSGIVWPMVSSLFLCTKKSLHDSLDVLICILFDNYWCLLICIHFITCIIFLFKSCYKQLGFSLFWSDYILYRLYTV